MGLITQVLTLPVAPLRGFTWVLGHVLTAAEQEYYDPAPVREQLADLEKDLLAGRVSEEEFDRREDELLDRLDFIQRERARLGLDS
ncbi:gas vesicle protein GvpG [Streptomyces sp. NPDC050560]|uniref:gas vesicle protein GvpG n=1 Tax=Streptomyces sp. NPDC050560 TaxID=3365630 RepID=UPI0037A295D0